MGSDKKKCYIAGPMSGYPDFNFPAFFKAEEYLKALGWVVFNPANKEQEKKLDEEAYKEGDPDKAAKTGFDFRSAYAWDLAKVVEADAIYMLPGWEQSPGACGEHAVAVAMKKHYKDEYRIIYG